MEAYKTAMLGQPPVRPSRYGLGTIGALWSDYCRSVLFANLSAGSKGTYRKVIAPILAEHGSRTVAGMTRDHVRRIAEDIGVDKPGMANLTISLLRLLMDFAVENGWRADNPVSKIKRYKLGKRHSWTDQELAAFEKTWPLGTRERLAFAILLFTTQRVSDAVTMRRSDIVDGMIRVKQKKTGVELLIKIHPALSRAIRASRARGIHLLGDRNGRPIKSQTLTLLIRTAARAAGLGRECVAHGLRKAGMRKLAEHGAGAKEIAAVSGHQTLREVERYTEAANQARLAGLAIDRLPNEE